MSTGIYIYDRNSKAYENPRNWVGHQIMPTKCELTEGLNTITSLELEIPMDDEINSLFVSDALIGIEYNPRAGKSDEGEFYDIQLFRIYQLEKTPYLITAKAYPRIYDLDRTTRIGRGTHGVRAVNKPANEALKAIFASLGLQDKPIYWTNKTNKATAYYEDVSLFDAVFGDEDNSFINRWGGEVLFNNMQMRIYDTLDTKSAADRVHVQMGHNMTGISYTVDTSNTYNYVIPRAYNGRSYINGSGFNSSAVKSPHDYSNAYVVGGFVVKEYSDIKLKQDASSNEDPDVIVCKNQSELNTALYNRAMKEFTVNHIDMPIITYDVDLIDISDLPEYEDIRKLVELNIGDSVVVYNQDIGINTTARVIERVIDFVNGNVSSIKLGQYQDNFFTNASKQMRTLEKCTDTVTNTIRGGTITGVIDGANAQSVAQKNNTNNNDVNNVRAENFSSSGTYGAMAIGTKGLRVSQNYSNGDWNWSTMLDFAGIYYGAINSTKTAHWKIGDVEVTINGANVSLTKGDQNILLNGNQVQIVDGSNHVILNGNGLTAQWSDKNVVLSNNGAQLKYNGSSWINMSSNGLNIGANGRSGHGITGTYKVENQINVVGGVVVGAS